MSIKGTAQKNDLAYLWNLLFAVLAIILSFVIGGMIVYIMGYEPIGAFKTMLVSAVAGKNALAETVVKATPLLFTGLSYALARQCGIINLGIEGQLYIGGLCTAICALYIKGLPMAIHIPICICAGFLGGGFLGALVIWLRNRFGASELITTIMFNYIASILVQWMVNGPMRESPTSISQTAPFLESALLPRILEGTRLHLGTIIALLCLMFYFVFLWKTPKGYEVRLSGLNNNAAKYAGISDNSLLVMFIAGGLGGLCGATELLANQYRLVANFSANWGWDAIAVALLGDCTPLGVLFSAFFMGGLRNGALKMQLFNKVPSAVVSIIRSLVILFVVSRNYLNRRMKQAEMMRLQKGGAHG